MSDLKCFCPDDCNCRRAHRTNYCGCRAHDTNAPTLADQIAAARALGQEHATNAAGWIADGNTSTETLRRALQQIEDGDPAFWDGVNAPNLSGEMADGMTPVKLYEAITGNDHADAEQDAGLGYETTVGSVVDALADAYESGVSEAFEPACERELRAWLGLDVGEGI